MVYGGWRDNVKKKRTRKPPNSMGQAKCIFAYKSCSHYEPNHKQCSILVGIYTYFTINVHMFIFSILLFKFFLSTLFFRLAFSIFEVLLVAGPTYRIPISYQNGFLPKTILAKLLSWTSKGLDRF